MDGAGSGKSGGRKNSAVHLGPGAASLILIFVMLALSILAMLTLVGARNDAKASERAAQVTQQIYELEARTQVMYARIAAAAEGNADAQEPPVLAADAAARINAENEAASDPERLTASGDVLSWVCEDEARRFDCAVRIISGGSGEDIQAGGDMAGAGDIGSDEDRPDGGTGTYGTGLLKWVMHRMSSLEAS